LEPPRCIDHVGVRDDHLVGAAVREAEQTAARRVLERDLAHGPVLECQVRPQGSRDHRQVRVRRIGLDDVVAPEQLGQRAEQQAVHPRSGVAGDDVAEGELLPENLRKRAVSAEFAVQRAQPREVQEEIPPVREPVLALEASARERVVHRDAPVGAPPSGLGRTRGERLEVVGRRRNVDVFPFGLAEDVALVAGGVGVDADPPLQLRVDVAVIGNVPEVQNAHQAVRRPSSGSRSGAAHRSR
jgi:hypothetical protein